ncbi:extensin family protein [Sphingomonas sp. ID1715]|uniref:extensin-like domain-containing protein n=1 Tax=Sphingomonas sp. ID1715 TaxID=1656898 RepID=UPI0014898C10|nr:extensin family protein [Sphingomonas sp. ID1715]NNM77146.1 extensin family protein [Sphingomonas sp. ID1715]
MGRNLAVVAGVALLLAACTGRDEQRAQPRPSPPNRLTIDSPQVRVCLANLGQLARFSALPDRDYGGGCYSFASVKLLDAGVPVSNLGAMNCSLAATFSAWVRNGVMPAARLYLRSEIAKVETFGTYSCRNVNGALAGRLSEHATANAVDVSGFLLADGRQITLKKDWNSPDADVRSFLLVIRTSACRRFKTVLSPDYNSLHADHFHLDMGRGPFCR